MGSLRCEEIAGWKEYDETKSKAWDEYADFDKRELLRFRESNRQAYYDYLDADKLGDYDRRTKMEQSVPELVQYKKAVGDKYTAYAKIEKDALARYNEIDKRAYKVYQEEDKIAYKAYQDAEKKNAP